jgi:hypothetical protein
MRRNGQLRVKSSASGRQAGNFTQSIAPEAGSRCWIQNAVSYKQGRKSAVVHDPASVQCSSLLTAAAAEATSSSIHNDNETGVEVGLICIFHDAGHLDDVTFRSPKATQRKKPATRMLMFMQTVPE